MKFARRVLVIVASIVVAIMAVPGVASAQSDSYDSYDDSSSGKIERLAEGTADSEGKFSYPYKVPEDIDSSYEIFVTGTAADGGKFELALATITPNFAGRTVSLEGDNLEPNSEYVLEVRGATAEAPAGAEAGTSPASGDDADSEEAIAPVGESGDSDTRRLLGGLAVVALLIAAAVVYGLRLAARESY